MKFIKIESKKRKRIVIFALVVLAIVASMNTVLMVSPVAFDYNEETAVNNAFQEEDEQNGGGYARCMIAEIF